MAVVYEVNLTIEAQIQSPFREWLRGHIRQMLELPGFQTAALFETEPGSAGAATIEYVVQYQLDSRASLQTYFAEVADQMRQQGIDRFGSKMTVYRRILLPI